MSLPARGVRVEICELQPCEPCIFVAPRKGSEGRNDTAVRDWFKLQRVAPRKGSEGRNFTWMRQMRLRPVTPRMGSVGRNSSGCRMDGALLDVTPRMGSVGRNIQDNTVFRGKERSLPAWGVRVEMKANSPS